MKLKKPKFWDYPKPSFLALLLLPFSFLFKLINFFKRKNKIKKNKIFTICIGNIYLGGTGKTSLAIRVAANIYQAIGKKIINNNISYIEDRVFVNNYEKLKITFFKIFSKGKSSNKLKTHNIKLHNAIKDLPGANKN